MLARAQFLLTALSQADLPQRLRAKAERYARAGALMAAGGLISLLVLAFVGLAIWSYLTPPLGPGNAALVVALTYLIVAAALGAAGYAQLKAPRPAKRDAAAGESMRPALPLTEIAAFTRAHLTEIAAASAVIGLLAGRSRRR